MVETNGCKSRGVRRLPTLRFEGDEYFIDNRLDDFRTVTPPIREIEFVRFGSAKGLRMLDECVWHDCDRCGRLMALSRHCTESQVRCCDCGGRVPVTAKGAFDDVAR